MTTPDLEPQHPEFFADPEDGSVTLIGKMPDCIAISHRLLSEAAVGPYAAIIRRDGDHVTIRCDNGQWVFRIAEWRQPNGGDNEGSVAVCVLQT